jgi:hypothetical protein
MFSPFHSFLSHVCRDSDEVVQNLFLPHSLRVIRFSLILFMCSFIVHFSMPDWCLISVTDKIILMFFFFHSFIAVFFEMFRGKNMVIEFFL